MICAVCVLCAVCCVLCAVCCVLCAVWCAATRAEGPAGGQCDCVMWCMMCAVLVVLRIVANMPSYHNPSHPNHTPPHPMLGTPIHAWYPHSCFVLPSLPRHIPAHRCPRCCRHHDQVSREISWGVRMQTLPHVEVPQLRHHSWPLISQPVRLTLRKHVLARLDAACVLIRAWKPHDATDSRLSAHT